MVSARVTLCDQEHVYIKGNTCTTMADWEETLSRQFAHLHVCFYITTFFYVNFVWNSTRVYILWWKVFSCKLSIRVSCYESQSNTNEILPCNLRKPMKRDVALEFEIAYETFQIWFYCVRWKCCRIKIQWVMGVVIIMLRTQSSKNMHTIHSWKVS